MIFFAVLIERSFSLNDLMRKMHIADGLECEINNVIAFYKHEHVNSVMLDESVSDLWMSWDSTFEEDSVISMMCFFYSIWKVAFDYLTENDFKGDVNEIGENMCILRVNLCFPPEPEVMLNKLLGVSKSLEARKEIKELKEEVASLKAVVHSSESNEGDEDRKRQRL